MIKLAHTLKVLRTHTYLYGTKFVFDNDPREVLAFLPGMLHCKFYKKHELGQGWHVVFNRMWNPWDISESLKRVPLLIPDNEVREIILDVPVGLHTVSEHFKEYGITRERTDTQRHQTFLNKVLLIKELPLEVRYEKERTIFSRDGKVIKDIQADREIREKKEVFVRNLPPKK